ncbi:hypothetical protein BG015_006368 [Linnemannia schmuckeri]|uniref:F-box domain-containing protein n=1 Tax=Linnemannia schmuckeri TaxID=64567 RepID=A0A9P5VBZ5_9FUNG|nr:hypothetical protein BG015_006368 [Linnemannia schmuckeri]
MSTIRKLTPTEVALSLPEVLEAMGPFIDPSDLGSYVLVNRLWNEVFTPWLWHIIDDEALNWSNVLLDLSFNCPPPTNGDTIVEKDEKWLRAILAKHGRNIRHLSMTWIALLMNAGAAGSTITRLRSLSAKNFPMYHRFEEEAALFDLPVLAGLGDYDRPTVEQQQVIISSYIISPAFEDALEPAPRLRLYKFIRGVVASQRFWLLVLQNPDLESLHLGHHLRLNGEAFKKEAMIKIMQLGQYYIPIDLGLDQPFPRLRSLEVKGPGFLPLASLLNLLEFLPSLEQLTISKLQPNSRYSPDSDSKESITDKQKFITHKHSSRLRGLHFVKFDQEVTIALDETIAGLVLPAMPFLTEITLKVLMPVTVAALVEQCLHLETVKVIDNTSLNNIEMVLPANMPLVLLHGCPTLRHLYIACHSVDARLLLEKPIVCRGLETFCCQVVGVDRLTPEEEALYDSWATTPMQEEQTPTTTTTATTTADTSEEEKRRVIEKHQTSQDLHYQIYSAFSELTHLRRLDFGYDLHAHRRHRGHWPPLDQVPVPETILVAGRAYHKEYPPNFDTLKLSLESGLGRLRTLVRLKEFGFRGVDHRVRTKELDWMVRVWPRLEKVLGVEDDLHMKHFGLNCEQSRMLMEYVQTTLCIKYE